MLVPVPLEERVRSAAVIVEGKVISQQCRWDVAHKLIYTIHTVEAYKLFKGTLTDTLVKVATLGGIVNETRLDVSNETVLQTGDMGIFCLEPHDAGAGIPSLFDIYAAAQGFFRYTKENNANDVFHNYDIDPVLYKSIVSITKKNFTVLKQIPSPGAHTASAPVLTSFAPDTLAAGIYDELIIQGSGFGSVRNSGFVQFPNANDGGTSFIKPDSTEYLSWNDTLIKLRVPTAASTGVIKVYNGSDTATTSDSIFIKFASLNVSYNDIRWQPVLIGKDLNQGYEWHFNTNDFNTRPGARASFLRAFQSWRCGTLVQWDIGSNTNLDSVGQDGVCVIRFDSAGQLPSGVLGRCHSFYLGCFKGGGNMEWYVAELDIEFNDNFTWNYDIGTPAFNEYDFESVAVHELGHGQQLGHVNSTSEIMHYSIGNGQSKRTLSNRDLEGGNYIMDRSTAASVCGRDKITTLTPAFCSLIPICGFTQSKLTFCPGEQAIFMDTSKGSTTSYSWDFGPGANPPTASSKGPHPVTYSTAGIKEVKLVVEGDAGKDSITRNITVHAAPPSMSGINIMGDDTICLGVYDFEVPPVTDALAYFWYLNTGGSMANNDTIGSVTMTLAGGPFRVWLYSQNLCGRSDTIEKFFMVRDDVHVEYEYVIHADTILASNHSTFADSYEWKFGNNQSTNTTDLSLKVSGSGVYPVTLIARNKCGEDSVTKNIEVVMAGLTPQEKNKLVIFPNPSRSQISLDLAADRKPVHFSITDLTGKTIQSGEMGYPYLLNIATLSSGLYFIEVESGEKIYQGKLVKE